MGWLLVKRAQLMSFYGWTEHYTLYGITGAKSWAYLAYATENRMSLFGNNIRPTTKTYIGQEIDRILARKKK